MKNSTLGAVVLGATATIASAGYVGDVKLYDSWGNGSGGEFRAVTQPGFSFPPGPLATGTKFQGGIAAANGLFETFCLEAAEAMSFGTLYKVDIQAYAEADLTNANYSGTSRGGRIDYISEETAYLYWKFITKSLSHYDYTDTGANTERKDDASQLQLAIWKFEEEITGTLTDEAASWEAEAIAAVAGGWSGAGTRVFVMNLYTNSTRRDWQSQLIAIPLPGGAGMASVGILGLGLVRRRR